MPADIILLAAIAAFVLLRLRGVLGQKIGHDQPPATPDRVRKEGERVIQIKSAAPAANNNTATEALSAEEEERGLYAPEVEQGIAAIRAVDRQFRMKDFLAGAGMAFDMINEAFRKDDRDTLSSLLSKELFQEFVAELERRKEEAEYEEATLVSILSAVPVEAGAEKHKGRITVAFTSEQMAVRRTAEGTVAEGASSEMRRVEDVWTFERDLQSSNPNWTIVAT